MKQMIWVLGFLFLSSSTFASAALPRHWPYNKKCLDMSISAAQSAYFKFYKATYGRRPDAREVKIRLLEFKQGTLNLDASYVNSFNANIKIVVGDDLRSSNRKDCRILSIQAPPPHATAPTCNPC